MWKLQLFGSLPVLLDFVNGHGLGHDQFKIVVVPPRIWQRRGGPRYYLIYRTETPEATLVGAEARAQARSAIDEEAAIDTAEQIIHDAQYRGEGPDDPG